MNLDHETIASLWKKWVQPSNATERVELEFGDISITLVTNDEKVATEIRSYYREFLSEENRQAIVVFALESPLIEIEGSFVTQRREGEKQGIKEMFLELPDGRVIRKVRTGMYFLVGNGKNLAIGPCRNNIPQVVNFINNRVIERLLRQDYLLGHASGLVQGDRCVAICGFSGAGKSTLALHVLADSDVSRSPNPEQMALLSNDRILFRRDGELTGVYGVPKHPRINPGTIVSNERLHNIIDAEKRERFLAMPTDELWNLEEKYDCLMHECFGEKRFVLRNQLGAVFFLNWQRNSPELTIIRRVDLRERIELLPALMKEPGLFFQVEEGFEAPEMGVEFYLDHLRYVDIFEVSGIVDFASASLAIRRYLDRAH